MTSTVTDDRRVNRLLEWLEKQRQDYADMVTDAGDASLWCKEEAELIRDHIKTVEDMRDHTRALSVDVKETPVHYQQAGLSLTDDTQTPQSDPVSEVIALRAENDRLRAALEPFAEADNHYDQSFEDDYSPCWAEFFTIGDFRRARAALNASKAELGED